MALPNGEQRYLLFPRNVRNEVADSFCHYITVPTHPPKKTFLRAVNTKLLNTNASGVCAAIAPAGEKVIILGKGFYLKHALFHLFQIRASPSLPFMVLFSVTLGLRDGGSDLFVVLGDWEMEAV